jgi:hypothetical protein
MALARFGEADAHMPQHERGEEEACCVDDERNVTPESRRDGAADAGADGEHHPPRRSYQHVRGTEIFRGDNVR